MLWQDPVIGGQEGKRQLFRLVSKERHDRSGTQHYRLVENGPFRSYGRTITLMACRWSIAT